MLGRVPRRSSSADKALWLRMHPSPKARRTIFLKNDMLQISSIHPPPQCGFLNLEMGIVEAILNRNETANTPTLGNYYRRNVD